MKLSIITVNFNNKQGLQKTIDSVISQTYQDFEWIIIDGGSTDGSKELIEKYQEHFSYWCCENDKGVYNAMNKGIAQASGCFLNFMNSGDCFASNRVLEKTFMNDFNADILYGNVVVYNKNKQYTLKTIHSDHIKGVDLISSSICHQAAFIRRELFCKYGLYDETLKIVSDWKFFFEVILFHHCSVKYMDLDVVIYDLNGISSKNMEMLKAERLKVLRKLLPEFVVEDYINTLHVNEVFNYKLGRMFFSFIYRLVLLYEKKKGFAI